MKPSEIYRKAAEIIDGGITVHSCDAVSNAIKGGSLFGSSPESQAYAALFCPDGNCRFMWGNDWSDDFQECQQCRVLALLFMSEIAKDSE